MVDSFGADPLSLQDRSHHLGCPTALGEDEDGAVRHEVAAPSNSDGRTIALRG